MPVAAATPLQIVAIQIFYRPPALQCVDKTGCMPALDHSPTDEDRKRYGTCDPNWHCCDWDDGTPGMENKCECPAVHSMPVMLMWAASVCLHYQLTHRR